MTFQNALFSDNHANPPNYKWHSIRRKSSAKRKFYKGHHSFRREVCSLRIGSCLACAYRVMDARGKFGEHERSIRVVRGVAESNSSFLSALQTSQVHP